MAQAAPGEADDRVVARRNVILAGNNEAAVRVLDLLLEALTPQQVLVIAPPGGPRHGWQESLARAATHRGVRALTPEDVNDDATVAAVRAHDADLLLSVYYTKLFRQPFLDAVGGPCLNFHPSLLPRHRGTAPLIHAIAEGDTRTGLSVHHIALGVDTGRLVWQRPLPILEHDTGFVLHQKMTALVAAAAAELLRGWLAGEPIPDGDDQTGEPSYHSSQDPRLNHIDWTQPRRRVRDVVRALAPPLPGAFAHLRGAEIVIAGVTEVDDGPALPAGTVRIGRDGPRVWAADGALRIDEIRLRGEAWPGIAMPVEDGEVLA